MNRICSARLAVVLTMAVPLAPGPAGAQAPATAPMDSVRRLADAGLSAQALGYCRHVSRERPDAPHALAALAIGAL